MRRGLRRRLSTKRSSVFCSKGNHSWFVILLVVREISRKMPEENARGKYWRKMLGGFGCCSVLCCLAILGIRFTHAYMYFEIAIAYFLSFIVLRTSYPER